MSHETSAVAAAMIGGILEAGSGAVYLDCSGAALHYRCSAMGTEIVDALTAAGFKILPPRPRWRHRKRGTTYTVVASARVQASTRPIVEGDVVAVYVGDDDGWYVRETGEFTDGRFEQIEETADAK